MQRLDGLRVVTGSVEIGHAHATQPDRRDLQPALSQFPCMQGSAPFSSYVLPGIMLVQDAAERAKPRSAAIGHQVVRIALEAREFKRLVGAAPIQKVERLRQAGV